MPFSLEGATSALKQQIDRRCNPTLPGGVIVTEWFTTIITKSYQVSNPIYNPLINRSPYSKKVSGT